jgi:hypothetical protein
MPQSGGGSRASMGIEHPKGSLPSRGASRPRAGAKASALKALARLLARQAAREVSSSRTELNASAISTSQRSPQKGSSR